jgi:hypothetical protein
MAEKHEVSVFRLARESLIFMQRYEVLGRFVLGRHNELPSLPISHSEQTWINGASRTTKLSPTAQPRELLLRLLVVL